ncbi:MAG: response regulator [Bacteroidetes bacterium]|nr:response regulator [Bacteroidota bacterium]
MKKILIIEDNADVRENLAEILELGNYHTLTAENGKIGVEKALQELPDLILCDVMMPELDGFGVLHILGRNQKTADIPFVFLTAKSEKEDFRRGMSLGADDYIVKPFDDEQLMQTIEARLKKSERLRAASQNSGGALEAFINEAKATELLHSLSNNRESRHFRKKDLIFKEGETPRWLYYVESGQIKVFKTSEDGRELIVKVAKTGDFLGYLALLKNDFYPESAAALEDTNIRLIPRDDFNALLNSNRDVASSFLKMLASHVAEREQQLLDLAYNSVRRRTATALIYLHNQGNQEISLLREDLAALAGTAKETLIRTLTDFKTEGLVEIKDGVIHLRQMEKLRNMPN